MFVKNIKNFMVKTIILNLACVKNFVGFCKDYDTKFLNR